MTDEFTTRSISVYIDPNIDIHKMTTQEIIDYFDWDVKYSYAQKIVTFVRQLNDKCFFSLPYGVQKSAKWIEDNHAYDMSVSEIMNRIGVSNYHVRLAKTFLEMENRGYFDNENAYDF